jgi:hypothetical protein
MSKAPVSIIPEKHASGNDTESPLAARAAFNDALDRSTLARKQHPQFFNRDHMQRVEDVRAIVDGFFPVKESLYVNHRANRGKPFSVVKVFNIGSWPAKKNKQRDLYAPLAALGVFEVKLSQRGNHYNFSIR